MNLDLILSLMLLGNSIYADNVSYSPRIYQNSTTFPRFKYMAPSHSFPEFPRAVRGIEFQSGEDELIVGFSYEVPFLKIPVQYGESTLKSSLRRLMHGPATGLPDLMTTLGTFIFDKIAELPVERAKRKSDSSHQETAGDIFELLAKRRQIVCDFLNGNGVGMQKVIKGLMRLIGPNFQDTENSFLANC